MRSVLFSIATAFCGSMLAIVVTYGLVLFSMARGI